MITYNPAANVRHYDTPITVYLWEIPWLAYGIKCQAADMQRAAECTLGSYFGPRHRITGWRPHPSCANYATVFRREILTVRDYVGKVLAHHADIADSRVNALFEKAMRRGYCADYMQLADGEWMPGGDTFVCGCCGDRFANSESNRVYMSHGYRQREQWCESCTDDEAFHDDANENHYSCAAFTSVEVDGQTVCVEAHDDLYFWESDQEYHWEEEEDEDEEPSPQSIPDYHESPKPWKNQSYAGQVFGCELELKARSSREDVAECAEDAGLFYERDGSLDRDLGIEIIGQPMTLTQHQDENGPWLKFLASVKRQAIGWNAGTGYGLHVSINRAGLSNMHVGKILVFAHSNKSLCEKVAGRSESRWATYVQKRIKDGTQTWEGCRYEAMAIRGPSRLEFRIFRSTLAPHGFLRAVEFTAAIVEYCRTASAQKLTAADFVEWLILPGNSKPYRNLCQHLSLSVNGKAVKSKADAYEAAA